MKKKDSLTPTQGVQWYSNEIQMRLEVPTLGLIILQLFIINTITQKVYSPEIKTNDLDIEII
jgi:hypothetical protein